MKSAIRSRNVPVLRVEVLELEPRGIHVAEYLTELPPRELLEQRLHEAVIRARRQIEQQRAEEAPAKPAPARRKRVVK